jgi:hypothetical protein
VLILSMFRMVRFAAIVTLTVCATAAVLAIPKNGQYVRAEDRNGDGRPDEWRRYDRQGHLARISVDSNFDGRSDVEEYYDSDGVLLRRESDRDFNGQIDLVEDFDPATHERARSVVDSDYDGLADLLVLFHDGRPVFTKRAPEASVREVEPSPVAEVVQFDGEDDDPLVPLTDPFQSDTAVRGLRTFARTGCAGLTTSGGLPCPQVTGVAPVSTSAVVSATVARHSSSPIAPRAPRGPPVL